MAKPLKTNYTREIKLIKSAVEKLNIDLIGQTVLTEVGSNNYILSPIIPLLAGAEKVFAWTRDSRFGMSADIISECISIAKSLGLENRLHFSSNVKDTNQVAEADIITNSGFLRPLNENLLKYAKSNAVLPLMFEKWEMRASDIDINYCNEKGIKVAGTWENHPDIKVFSGSGPLGIKLLMEAGLEVYQNNILVWSDDHFGEETTKALKGFGASHVINSINIEDFYSNLSDLDAIYICDYDEHRKYFGEVSIFDIDKIKEVNPSLKVVHLYGNIDATLLSEQGIDLYPNKDGYAEVMTETLAYLGPKLLINLQAAGYKVAQTMLEGKDHDLAQPVNY